MVKVSGRQLGIRVSFRAHWQRRSSFECPRTDLSVGSDALPIARTVFGHNVHSVPLPATSASSSSIA